MAGAAVQGWRLNVEDCAFSREFILPVGLRSHAPIELEPGYLLPARHRASARATEQKPTLYVTFCDRPFRTGGYDVETTVAGGRYRLCALDAMLTVAGFDQVFVLGAGLHSVAVADRLDWTTGRISGETLFHYTSLCSRALSELIVAAPGQYLGIIQLITRSLKYRSVTGVGRKAIVKSLLHYCQLNGLPVPEPAYRQLLLKLDAAGVGETESAEA
jgi:hypothetical protein